MQHQPLGHLSPYQPWPGRLTIHSDQGRTALAPLNNHPHHTQTRDGSRLCRNRYGARRATAQSTGHRSHVGLRRAWRQALQRHPRPLSTRLQQPVTGTQTRRQPQHPGGPDCARTPTIQCRSGAKRRRVLALCHALGKRLLSHARIMIQRSHPTGQRWSTEPSSVQRIHPASRHRKNADP